MSDGAISFGSRRVVLGSPMSSPDMSMEQVYLHINKDTTLEQVKVSQAPLIGIDGDSPLGSIRDIGQQDDRIVLLGQGLTEDQMQAIPKHIDWIEITRDTSEKSIAHIPTIQGRRVILGEGATEEQVKVIPRDIRWVVITQNTPEDTIHQLPEKRGIVLGQGLSAEQVGAISEHCKVLVLCDQTPPGCLSGLSSLMGMPQGIPLFCSAGKKARIDAVIKSYQIVSQVSNGGVRKSLVDTLMTLGLSNRLSEPSNLWGKESTAQQPKLFARSVSDYDLGARAPGPNNGGSIVASSIL